jgi:pimeloyl-ACP methyl ester carboxylesterase
LENSATISDYLLFSAHSSSYLAARTPDELTSLSSSATFTRLPQLQSELAEEVDITDLLCKIDATTLVIGCTEDSIATEQQSKFLFASIHDSRYAAVNSGNAVLVERPAEVVWLVDSFINDPQRYEAGAILPTAYP